LQLRWLLCGGLLCRLLLILLWRAFRCCQSIAVLCVCLLCQAQHLHRLCNFVDGLRDTAPSAHSTTYLNTACQGVFIVLVDATVVAVTGLASTKYNAVLGCRAAWVQCSPHTSAGAPPHWVPKHACSRQRKSLRGSVHPAALTSTAAGSCPRPYP
jgi:hypothetical protein